VQPRSLEQRVTTLERQMQELQDLPSRVTQLESQVLQRRREMHDEVSAIRTEVKAADDETRVFMRILHEDALARIEAIGEGDDAER
jgi:hypothetical protein